MIVSLSILEYEPDLSAHVENLTESHSLSTILRLIEAGSIQGVHIDVMRPPMIPKKTRFSTKLITQLHEELHERTLLTVHLMVEDPFPIIEEINGFISTKERFETTVIIQRESFSSEEETVKALRILKGFGYRGGICLNLPTPSGALTRVIVEVADTVLLMTVPMGRGGQRYGKKATDRIAHFSREFPDKVIEVDGGLNPQTIVLAARAGAKVAVVGSFITRNKDSRRAILELKEALNSLT